MVYLNKLLTSSVYLAVLYANAVTAAAAPAPGETANPLTTRVHSIGKRGLKLTAFSPSSTFETFENGIDHPSSNNFAPVSLEESTLAFIKDRLSSNGLRKSGAAEVNVKYRDGFKEGESSYAYVQQEHDGIVFANAVGNVAFKGDKVVAFGNSFVEPAYIADSTPTVTLEEAISTAEALLEGTRLPSSDAAPKLEYVVLEDGSVILAHVVQIRNEDRTTWWQAYVNAHSGEVKSVVDFVAHATYRALPLERQYPTQGFELIEDPQLKYGSVPSPDGWHFVMTAFNMTETAGNNVVSYKNFQSGATRQQGTGGLPRLFDYPADLNLDATAQSNVDAANVNTFYVVNELHDIWYLYGFTEQAYNFQGDNYGRGGKQYDRVMVSVQDSRAYNNAFFATPPDGQGGEMMLHLWNYHRIPQDISLSNDVVIHEYTHGLTNRLTGGGTATCLSTSESLGLGEGWSDAMADWVSVQSDSMSGGRLRDYEIGAWAWANSPRGLREFAYSVDPKIAFHTYADVAWLISGQHRVGTVWANILHNVHAQLLSAHGYGAEAKSNPGSRAGNAVFLHLFVDALKLQPCNPSFVDARAAWIQADANRYKGENRCLLWRVFASKGLGVNAVSGVYVDDGSVPSDC